MIWGYPHFRKHPYSNKAQIVTRAVQPPLFSDLQTAMARLRFEPRSSPSQEYPAPETNSEFTPENGWLEYDCFMLGFGLFSGAFAVTVV